MQRLGIVGGTFDPIHIGHVLLALFALERLPLDRVLFVPAAYPPHKESRHRSCRVRRGKSYTVDTLRQLRVDHPDCDLHLIIGEDNVSQLSTWYDPRGILDLCTVVAGSRVTADLDADSALARQIVALDTPLFQISSTEIRQRLADDLPVRYLLPENVEAYVRDRKLYGASPATS